jgi:hypothetical protein
MNTTRRLEIKLSTLLAKTNGPAPAGSKLAADVASTRAALAAARANGGHSLQTSIDANIAATHSR